VILSVVIPVHDGRAFIGQCLAKVFRSSLRDFEVIVVDDHSTDGTAEIVRSFPCRLLTSATRGVGAARNLGVAHAAGPLIYFLDADILIEPDNLERIVDAFDRHPEVSAIFGSFGKDTVPQNFASVYKNLLHHYTHQNANREAATFCGGFSGIRREVFREVGGFDPAYDFMEDVELGCRLYRRGYRIRLDPELQATHCKYYTLAAMIKSDFFGRAIPWTRIILHTRVFRNDLNTRVHNVLSVPLSFLLLMSLLNPTLRLWLALPLALTFLALNWSFLAFTHRERGLWFSLRASLLCWFSYLYSGVGAALGAAMHVWEYWRAPASVELRTSQSSGEIDIER
jgi:glycosyltransferase involved in cell wall biosynthesis